jgi:hypothetical protein
MWTKYRLLELFKGTGDGNSTNLTKLADVVVVIQAFI